MARPRGSGSIKGSFSVGDRVFFNHPEDSWVLGTVKTALGKRYSCSAEGQQETHQVGEQDLHTVVESSLQPVHDLLRMSYLHDSSLLYHVRMRYWEDIIYTNIGPIVLALNPYNYTLPHYMDDRMGRYIAEGEAVLTQASAQLPHSWAIAHHAYYMMRATSENQSILVSGESGAGKTEAAKIVLRYLGALSTHSATQEQREVAERINRRVNSTSPILEAFGNAKTLRNDNSSRFGKFMKVQFDGEGVMSGAHITPYLLERSRIITHAKGERSYHSFYQLVCGAAPEERRRMRLGQIADFRMLMAGGAPVIEGVDDAKDFAEVVEAMRIVGISEQQQQSLYNVLAAVLHLNNCVFLERDGQSHLDEAHHAAHDFAVRELLRGDPERFYKGLTTATRSVAGETITSPLDATRATEQRDSLCKALYEAVFLWLVAQINERIHSGDERISWIGLLDIFGFESFQKNSFEQVCINLTNEQLQQHYNHCIFTRDMEECRDEGINTESIVFADNQHTLELIQGNLGVLSLLDDEVQLGKGSDLGFAARLLEAQGKHASYIKHRTDRSCFGVRHYAGDVTYCVDGWREKNMDTLSDALKLACGASKDAFVAALVKPPQDAAGGRRPTVARIYKESLKDLMRVIHGTNPHWIRCVKPHHNKRPRHFHGQEVMTQLRSAGVLETVRIRKLGYSVRLPFSEFWARYRVVLPGGAGGGGRGGCAQVLQHLGVGPELGQVGKTKVFLKSEVWSRMEEARAKALTGCALVVQRHVLLRRSRWRAALCLRRAYAVRIQAFVRARSASVRMRLLEYDSRKGQLIENARRLLAAVREEERARVVLMTAEVDELGQLGRARRADYDHIVTRWYAEKPHRDAVAQEGFFKTEDDARGALERREQEGLLSVLDELKDDFDTMQRRQAQRERLEADERARVLALQLERERREQEERLQQQRLKAQAAWQRAAEERRAVEEERLLEIERQTRWLRDIEQDAAEALALHAQERRQVVREKRLFDQDPFCAATPPVRGGEPAGQRGGGARQRDRSPAAGAGWRRPGAEAATASPAPFAAPTFARLAAAGPHQARNLYAAAPSAQRRPLPSHSPGQSSVGAGRREAGAAKAAQAPSIDMVRRLQRMRRQASRDPARLVTARVSPFSADAPTNPSNPDWAPDPDGTVLLPDGTRCHVDELSAHYEAAGPAEY